MSRLQTRRVKNAQEVQSFFDDIARCYQDTHGPPSKLLDYRLSIIRSLLDTDQSGVLLEIGCGTGIHLFPLAKDFARVIGTDFCPGMIEAAEAKRDSHPKKDCIEVLVDPAEHLSGIEDNQINVVLCVGAFEHMLQKSAVLFQVKRVLKPGGAFICLTPNGSCCWYRWLAPRLGMDTRHLSTDQFLSKQKIQTDIDVAGFKSLVLGYWNFIPKADMPPWAVLLLMQLEVFGKLLHLPWLRGGIYFKAVKPENA